MTLADFKDSTSYLFLLSKCCTETSNHRWIKHSIASKESCDSRTRFCRAEHRPLPVGTRSCGSQVTSLPNKIPNTANHVHNRTLNSSELRTMIDHDRSWSLVKCIVPHLWCLQTALFCNFFDQTPTRAEYSSNKGCVPSIARTPLRISLRQLAYKYYLTTEQSGGFGKSAKHYWGMCTSRSTNIRFLFFSLVVRLFYQYLPNYNIFSRLVWTMCLY